MSEAQPCTGGTDCKPTSSFQGKECPSIEQQNVLYLSKYRRYPFLPFLSFPFLSFPFSSLLFSSLLFSSLLFSSLLFSSRLFYSVLFFSIIFFMSLCLSVFPSFSQRHILVFQITAIFTSIAPTNFMPCSTRPPRLPSATLRPNPSLECGTVVGGSVLQFGGQHE